MLIVVKIRPLVETHTMNAIAMLLLVVAADPSEDFVTRSKIETRKAWLPEYRRELNELRRKHDPDARDFKKVVDDMEAGKLLVAAKFPHYLTPKDGDYGRFQNAPVFEIVDDDNAIIDLGGGGKEKHYVWVKMKTKDFSEPRSDKLIDDADKYDSLVPYKIKGTRNYKSATGKRITPYAVPLTEEERTFGKYKLATDD
jgi:hypothetical protein